ncbi:hypothetical protein GLOIN_2v1486714 [Rhizophagus irregularis DAOM 181602=DAOM 197198]|nr:hypothetical protein GLOIN_2v1486714 [Rhizophagus irregularis DAOM 181602=DAOM 197198]
MDLDSRIYFKLYHVSYGNENFEKYRRIVDAIWSLTKICDHEIPEMNYTTIVPELHYGFYSFYWWIISNENETLFPIRLGQLTKVCLNEVDFILTIQTGSGNNKLMPMYCCQSGLHVVTELSSTKAISTVYKNCFNTSTRYLEYQAMGWNDKNILEILKQDI